jgi:hypothetical protein
MDACEMDASEMAACEMHATEMHACEMDTCEMDACEMHAGAGFAIKLVSTYFTKLFSDYSSLILVKSNSYR